MAEQCKWLQAQCLLVGFNTLRGWPLVESCWQPPAVMSESRVRLLLGGGRHAGEGRQSGGWRVRGEVVGRWGRGCRAGVLCWKLWCGVAWRGVAWCGVVWCGVVWCGVVLCGMVFCGIEWDGMGWGGVAWSGME